VLEVDQTPIGKTPRSCPATYIGFWDAIRKLFTETLEAKARGYAAARFSFNTGDGRCPSCEGQGLRTIEMSFLPDVKVPCDQCHGARFNPETLAVTWRGKQHRRRAADGGRRGGGVLRQHAQHRSPAAAAAGRRPGLPDAGPAQPDAVRRRGAAHQAGDRTQQGARRRHGRGNTPHTLYVLDEPTVGLHMADVERLLRVLHRLVDGGHSVLVIEHDLDVVAEADWVVDLGPEGGSGGGRLVAEGPPEAVVAAGTHTGQALAAVLARA
jgi:excinuclease ABC subunit A